MTLVALLLDPTRVILTAIDLDDDVLVRIVEVNPPTPRSGPSGLSYALWETTPAHEPTEQAFCFTV